MGKYDINLEQAATEILIRQHALTLGRAYSGKATLKRPSDSWEILQTIRAYNDNDPSEQIIIQELNRKGIVVIPDYKNRIDNLESEIESTV